jgi:hypothetical protein
MYLITLITLIKNQFYRRQGHDLTNFIHEISKRKSKEKQSLSKEKR